MVCISNEGLQKPKYWEEEIILTPENTQVVAIKIPNTLKKNFEYNKEF